MCNSFALRDAIGNGGRRVFRFDGRIGRQASVDGLEQFQPADAAFDVAHQVLPDLVGGLQRAEGLIGIALQVAGLAW